MGIVSSAPAAEFDAKRIKFCIIRIHRCTHATLSRGV